MIAARRSIYELPMQSFDGHPVLNGAVTQPGGGTGAQQYVAFRPDALQAIVSGNLGAMIGNLGFNAATILGHEGAHLWGSRDSETYTIPWGFKP